jgi:hydroxyethylthiazole kinase-like uncharacterized protein yjeF
MTKLNIAINSKTASKPADANSNFKLPARLKDGHKGTFGTVGVIGGQAEYSQVMLGGPVLCALAAMRVGAGLSVLALPEYLLLNALTIAPVATGLSLPTNNKGSLNAKQSIKVLKDFPREVSVWAVGPGWGVEKPQRSILSYLCAQTKPVVLDADGLNNLAAQPKVIKKRKSPLVLTPHAGEYNRLAAAFKLDPHPENEQKEAALSLAKISKSIVVLKGAATTVSDGDQTWQHEGNNPILATAGTGDVLTGIIAGLIAQFWQGSASPGDGTQPKETDGLSLFECACLAVQIHGFAAELWRKQNSDRGMLATDLVDILPSAFKS